MPPSPRSRLDGTSLVELLVATVIAALLASAGLSSFGRLFDAMDADRFARDLHRAVQTARALAVIEGVPVTLCPLDARHRCSGDWNRGWTLFRDPRRRGEMHDEAQLVRHFAARPARGHLSLRAFGTRRFFRMLPNGQTDWQNGRFVYCPPPDLGLVVRTVVINVQGRARMETRPPDDPLCEQPEGP